MNSKDNKDLNLEVLSEGADDTEEKVVIHSRSHRSHSSHSNHSSSSGSSSGSSSSHGHSKRRHSRKKRKRRALYIRIIIAAVIVIAVVAVLLIINHFDKANKWGSLPEEKVVLNGKFAVVPDVFDKDIDIIGEVAKYCYELDPSYKVHEVIDDFMKDDTRFDESVPVVLAPEIYNMPESYKFSGYRVEVSEKADLSGAIVFEFDKDQNIEINYLKTNTKYYYKVTLLPGDMGYVGSFKTSDTPRILSIDGIGNVRDIGNWKASDGKRIKQGILYKGTELEGIVESGYKLTEAGKKVMLDVLNIKYEMDLRSPADNPTNINALGSGVTHKYYNATMYRHIFSDEGKKAYKQIFTDLANPENYPMYLHCTYGKDRTGTVSFLLGALLGVSDNDLRREYELSSLFHDWFDLNDYESMLTALDAYDGDTTQEKVKNYLLDCGITAEQINSIRNIFLGE